MTSSCPKRRRAKRTCEVMAERTRFVAQIGDDQRDLPEPGRRRGNRLRRGLDTHRDIGDTRHVSLLVENRFVLSLQGGTFLGWFATAYISLRNSWDLGLDGAKQVLAEVQQIMTAQQVEDYVNHQR